MRGASVMSESHAVAILGASGYTGAELVRLIATHPGLRIAALTADRKAGQSMGEVFPHLRHLDLPPLTTIDAVDFAGDRPRLLRPAARHQPGGDRQAAARPEDRRSLRRLPPARPGGLRALVRPPAPGARPAGRGGLRADRVLPRRNPRRAAGRRHRLQRRHRHLRHPAAAQGRGDRPRRHHHRPRHRRLRRRALAQGGDAARGGLRGLPRLQRGQAPAPGRVRPGVRARRPAARSRSPSCRTCCRRTAASSPPSTCAARPRRSTRRWPRPTPDEPFIVVLPLGEAPATRHVRGSNFVHLGVIPDRRPGRVMVFSALDNLTKGSSGQAIQNANLMLGLPETMGLMAAPAVSVRRLKRAFRVLWVALRPLQPQRRLVDGRASSPSRACCRSSPS